MGRGILFRGKRLDDGRWVYGDLSQHKSGKVFVKSGSTIHSFEVDPATVGRYTGLPDRNGTKIFDGDIVISTNERRLSNRLQEVKFNALRGYWMCNPKREPVVIGNVFDNPELLEV